MTFTFSPSSLSLMKECPRCFWLCFNKGIKRPAGIFPSLPSGMDSVLKQHFDEFVGKGLPPELSQLNGEVKLFDNEELLKEWRNNRKGIKWKDEKGNVLRGAVDNLLLKGDKIIVLDYKTRGFPLKEDTAEHYQDQLDIYKFLLRKNGYETEDYTYLLFYYPEKVSENGDVVFKKELVKMNVDIGNAEKIFNLASELLSCDYCKWVDKCMNCITGLEPTARKEL